MRKVFIMMMGMVLVLGSMVVAQEAAKGKTAPAAGGEKKIDVTGKWSGTLEFKNSSGETGSGSAYMTLKQEGNKVSGTGGPNEGEQHPLREGKLEGNRLTFEALDGEKTMYFDLKVLEDQITGEIKHGKGNPGDSAKLSLKRVAEK